MGMVRDVMDIIANAYGSVPSGIDRSIASRVIQYFYDKGWMNSQEIAILVKAAGGQIRVSEQLMAESPLLFTYRDNATGDMVFQVRERGTPPSDETDEWIKNAKVNPDAESRGN
jgi:hypothetical protein